MKKVPVLVTLIFIVFSFLAPKPAFAQGSCEAERIGTGPSGSCKVTIDNCGDNYIATPISGARDTCRCDCISESIPPSNSGCVTRGSFPGGCRGAFSFACTDNSTYSWCCSDETSCEQIAPAPPVPPNQWGNLSNDRETIETAIGPINVSSPQDFIESILTLAIGVGGGIATLLIIFGGLQILTSDGSPEKVQSGKEIITAAISGLLLIVFAVFILRIIGVEILKIPGFE